MRFRAQIELLVALVALVGCVVSWRLAESVGVAMPITAGEPSRATSMYDPSNVLLALLLATVAGVFAVLGTARLRRR